MIITFDFNRILTYKRVPEKSRLPTIWAVDLVPISLDPGYDVIRLPHPPEAQSTALNDPSKS